MRGFFESQRYEITSIDILECLDIIPGRMWVLQTTNSKNNERAIMTATVDFLDRIRLDIWNITKEAMHWGEFSFFINSVGITYFGNRIDFGPRSRIENVFMISEGIPIINFGRCNILVKGESEAISAYGSKHKFSYQSGIVSCNKNVFGACWCVPSNISLTLLGRRLQGMIGIMLDNEYWEVTRTY